MPGLVLNCHKTPQCRQPSLSTSTRKPSGMRGTSPSPAALQAGQGAPAPPQLQARGPSQGRSGWFSQTQPRSSQLTHVVAVAPAAARLILAGHQATPLHVEAPCGVGGDEVLQRR
jgi:hypothetical protein